MFSSANFLRSKTTNKQFSVCKSGYPSIDWPLLLFPLSFAFFLWSPLNHINHFHVSVYSLSLSYKESDGICASFCAKDRRSLCWRRGASRTRRMWEVSLLRARLLFAGGCRGFSVMSLDDIMILFLIPNTFFTIKFICMIYWQMSESLFS